MGLKNLSLARRPMAYVFAVTLLALTGCMGTRNVTPADRVKNERFRYDCCDPGLSAGTKELCNMGKDSPNHALVDQDGNRYEFTWSDCEVGKEPWRKFENDDYWPEEGEK